MVDSTKVVGMLYKVKDLQNLLPWDKRLKDPVALYVAEVLGPLIVLLNDDLRLTLTYLRHGHT